MPVPWLWRPAGRPSSKDLPAAPGLCLCTVPGLLMCTGPAPWSLPFSALLAPLKDLWTGLSFLLHRHLQQSGALTMEALQDSPPGPVEGMDEDIADKVGPGLVAGLAGVLGEVC